MGRVTSRDVAAAAGVSQTTVSFVMNGRGDRGISAQTQELVRATAERLGYVPSAAARSLRSGRSRVVLCLEPGGVLSETRERGKLALSGYLSAAGYACVFQHHVSGQPLTDTWRLVHPDVVVSFRRLSAEVVQDVVRAGIPLINGIYASETGKEPPTRLDQPSIGRVQVDHLVSQGHHRLGYAAPRDDREDPTGTPRLHGVRARCFELGLPEPVVCRVGADLDGSGAGLAQWRSEGVTAVAAFNDVLALAVVSAAASAGLGVPDALAVIGADDSTIAKLAVPALTTVAIDLDLHGHHLARAVLELVDAADLLAEPRDGELLKVVVRASA
jgi:DNA-binding LacI/PurR family transcriptional regulator